MNMIGHETTKRQVNVALSSATSRNMSLPHMLFAGAAGCGKTLMAKEIAKLSNLDFISVPPENLKDHKSVIDVLETLNHDGYDDKGNRTSKIKPSILFLDEIHRIPTFGQEKLGIAMESFKVDTGRANKFYWVPYFTLVGATTLSGELSRPFLNRFKLSFIFRPYSYEESIDIVLMHASRLDIEVTKDAAEDIAKRGRGVPRILVSYLERCMDLMYAFSLQSITNSVTAKTFSELGIDKKGYTVSEIEILKTLYVCEKPIGLEALSIVTNESGKTIKNEMEPFLIQNGMMMRSGTGRIITRAGREYLDAQGYIAKRGGKIEISADYVRK